MFRPVAFDPYGRKRTHRRVPRWLVLLVSGVVAGAGGLLFVQEAYLPPRLSADASAHLKQSYEQADAERLQLRQRLEQTARELQGLQAERRQLQAQVQESRELGQRLREEITALVAQLPPDPRGGTVQVRAARFEAANGRLVYDVMLSRDRGVSQPLSAVMQLVVAGTPRNGPETTVRLQPVPLTMNAFESLRGGVPLPEGFSPRQATIHVLDQPQGRVLGMRVMTVK